MRQAARTAAGDGLIHRVNPQDSFLDTPLVRRLKLYDN
jgi:hypothetical protein